jgi:hypothetical protein
VHEHGVDAERLGERETLAEGDLVDGENQAGAVSLWSL